MEKKVYLIYQSSKGSKDLVYASVSKAQAFSVASRLQEEYSSCSFKVNFRVYEMPLNGFDYE